MRKKKKDEIKDEIKKPQWWQKDVDKDGNPITKTITRERLSNNAVLTLGVFLTRNANSLETSKTMRDVYNVLHQESHDFGTNQCSAALQELQNKGFLNMQRGKLTKKSDRTDGTTTTRKARFWLTPNAASKALTVDVKRWVIEDGKHIADEATITRQEAKESKDNVDTD